MTQVSRFDYKVIEEVLSSVPCARSLTVLLLLRNSEFAQIVELEFNPLDYNSYADAKDALFATSLLRKHASLPTGIDREQKARSSFEAAERTCEQTNARLKTRNAFANLLFEASRKIQSVLGSFQPEEMFQLAGWGPGVTLTIRGKNARTSNKFRQNGEVTQPLYRFLKPLWPLMFPTWELAAREYEGNRVIQVPKNAKTNRTIAVEPSINLFLQKGIGSMVRRRLKRFDVDLNDQRVNQKLAKIGSDTTLLTTVDFSSASDTISSQLVLDLLPFDWFRVLDLLRSPRGLYQERLIEYEKFSSMGNGFTFELESLIFWALALVCVPEDHPLRSCVSVYGDDVIIPTDCYALYSELCSYVGFTVNPEKSYSNSYYRESCGKHYWNGVDITPIFLRDWLTSYEVMRFHNRLIEYARQESGGLFRDKRFRRACSLLRQREPKLPLVPLGFGDTGFFSNLDDATPVFNRKLHRGWNFRSLVFVPETVDEDDHAYLLSRLYARSIDICHGNSETVPRSGRYRVFTVYTSDWPDLGAWS